MTGATAQIQQQEVKVEDVGMSNQPKSWRDVIKVHPAADLFPMMSPDELKALGEDIRQNGMRVDIAVTRTRDGHWSLVDGRNRLDAAEVVGLSITIAGYPPESEFLFVKVGDEARRAAFTDDPYRYALSANIHRRHLTGEQKRELIAKVLSAQPEKSNRSIAKQIKVDDKTVGNVRRELEQRAEIPHVSTVEDSKGRKQQVHKPVKARTEAVKATAAPTAPQAEHPIRAAFEFAERGKREWIESALGLASAIAEARKQFPTDREFALWLIDSDLEYLGPQARTALVDIAAELELVRHILEETELWSVICERMKVRRELLNKNNSAASAVPVLIAE
ncbi:ParB N-terminal domain-containing protein [Bradyrhizobium liaoningense]|uniref:ParB N-terminal domain-containing protein n=1 Tax=Bradyrhizobium liaoningense TaxID=43992 RepID=UPI001BACF5BA|nr:ParB N-terminal domain-containing protein [Bradyrhizobium liaoningense]MBR0945914.1 ParB N-terminal domain-containing protein [Bradyrhizobium liaoningense]MBR1028310.1 ParB N-terminal domain-containing protein [Bradyrhizobium liaoningense]